MTGEEIRIRVGGRGISLAPILALLNSRHNQGTVWNVLTTTPKSEDKALNMSKVMDSILELVGQTPMVRLGRLAADLEVEILAKLEFTNPGGSVKDRAALWAIEGAEREGRLNPGGVVVEASSGNMGTGLAIACAVKGYQMVVVMPETMSEERRHMLRALGAEIVLTPITGQTRGEVTLEDYYLATSKAAELAEERGGIWINQFENPHNLRAHYEGTGREIWEQTEGCLDVFVAMAGTAGTAIGVAQALKERNPRIRVIIGEPAASAVIAGGPPGGHHIQGVGAGFVPPFYDPELCDGLVTVSDEEARQGARQLARQEGIFAGYSSGANIAATLKVAPEMKPGQTLVTMINDTGLKYLSTDLFG